MQTAKQFIVTAHDSRSVNQSISLKMFNPRELKLVRSQFSLPHREGSPMGWGLWWQGFVGMSTA